MPTPNPLQDLITQNAAPQAPLPLTLETIAKAKALCPDVGPRIEYFRVSPKWVVVTKNGEPVGKVDMETYLYAVTAATGGAS